MKIFIQKCQVDGNLKNARVTDFFTISITFCIKKKKKKNLAFVLFFSFFNYYYYSSIKHQNQNISLCYKLRKYLVIGLFKTAFAVELIRPFMFANDCIVWDILPPKPVCLPHSNHLFYIYVLRLGQEEGYENSHGDDKSSKEKKET